MFVTGGYPEKYYPEIAGIEQDGGESGVSPCLLVSGGVSAGEVPDEAEVSTEVSGVVETFNSAWVSVSGRIPVSTAPLPELAASSVRSSPVSSSGAGDCFFAPAAIRIITTIAATAMIPVTFFLFMFGSIEGLFRFRCAHLFQRLLDCAVDALQRMVESVVFERRIPSDVGFDL